MRPLQRREPGGWIFPKVGRLGAATSQNCVPRATSNPIVVAVWAACNLDLFPDMKVRDLMQAEVITLGSSDTLGLADDIMRLGRIRHMPVVEGERVVGIISQRDLFRAAISSVLEFRPSSEHEWLSRIRVGEIMHAPVQTTGPDASMQSAVRKMLDQRIGCLPVVEGEKMVGLLSETDCLRHLLRLLEIDDAKPNGP